MSPQWFFKGSILGGTCDVIPITALLVHLGATVAMFSRKINLYSKYRKISYKSLQKQLQLTNRLRYRATVFTIVIAMNREWITR